MSEINILSFAKINLSIDVTGVLDSGMHSVDMIMHQLSFHDDVRIRFSPEAGAARGDVEIQVKTNRYYLPTDERNLAYKAAALLLGEYGSRIPGGKLRIDIHKRIPVAAGLAGGSGNGAAVLHGLNVLWKLRLDLQRLCELGKMLGSDVPFCIMGQARGNYCLPRSLRKDPLACCCARATGTGADLQPQAAIRKFLVIAKPPMGVSTREVYAGIDHCEIKKRPDNEQLAADLRAGDFTAVSRNCINVLENYTLNAYPKVSRLKKIMESNPKAELSLMSGSGPTVFSCFRSISEAKKECASLRKQGYEAYWTKTIK